MWLSTLPAAYDGAAAEAAPAADGVPGVLCGLSWPPPPPGAALLPPLLLPPLRHSRLLSWFFSPRRLAVTCGDKRDRHGSTRNRLS